MFKILIVDDEKKHRSGLMKLLYTVYPEDMLLEADGGEQALEVLHLLECDIVITDIRMSGMDGLELLRRIRQEFAHTAVIILSGYGEFDYARDAIKYGVSDYLLKPVDVGEVKKCLDKVRAEITEWRTKSESQESMKSQLMETEIIYMKYLMQQFVHHAEFEGKKKIREIFPIEQPGYLFLCEIAAGLNGSGAAIDTQEFQLAMKKYIQTGSSYSFELEEEGLYAVLVLCARKGDRSWFETMRRTLQRSLPNCRFSFYVSACHENMYEEGAKAYEEAMTVRKYRFYELGEYYDYDLLRDKIEGRISRFFDSAQTLMEHVKQNDIIMAYQAVKDAVQTPPDGRLPDSEQLCRAAEKQFYVWDYQPVFDNKETAVCRAGNVPSGVHSVAGFYVSLPDTLVGDEKSVMLSAHPFSQSGRNKAEKGQEEALPVQDDGVCLYVEGDRSECLEPIEATLRIDGVVRSTYLLPIRILDHREYEERFEQMYHGK